MQIRAPVPTFKTLKGLQGSVMAQKAEQTAINAGVKYGLQYATTLATQAGLSTVASAIPYVGWAYAAFQLFSSIFGGGKGHHQGTGSSTVQPDLSVNTTANQQFEGSSNLGAIAKLSHDAAAIIALVMRATNISYQSVIIGVGNANDQFNITVNVGPSRIFEIANQHSDTLTDWVMRSVVLALQALPLPDYAAQTIRALPFDPQKEVALYAKWVKNPNYHFSAPASPYGVPAQLPVPGLDSKRAWVTNQELMRAKQSSGQMPYGFDPNIAANQTPGLAWGIPITQTVNQAPIYPPAPTQPITFELLNERNPIPYYGNILGNRIENFSAAAIQAKIVAIITAAQAIAARQAQNAPVIVPSAAQSPSIAAPRLMPQALPVSPPQLPRVNTVDSLAESVTVSTPALTKQESEGKLWKIFLTAVSLSPFLL